MWYNGKMTQHDAFTGLPLEVDAGEVRRWSAMLVKGVFAILVVGVILTGILWAAVSGEVGALALSATFAACAGLLILRQALIAERL